MGGLIRARSFEGGIRVWSTQPEAPPRIPPSTAPSSSRDPVDVDADSWAGWGREHQIERGPQLTCRCRRRFMGGVGKGAPHLSMARRKGRRRPATIAASDRFHPSLTDFAHRPPPVAGGHFHRPRFRP
ncbi:Os02g0779800 [Oryza sativa Japonica Group]|uniref:Os02g0779800 protein n=2 Tax=Oryza sativa subsp. japonica TaxID=39947 RepID=Q6K7G0_ORYSJ|nr:hypothetical protein [Oryza sativa Japonica Group]BAS81206.1 Os02g0779800 [Oryza sativa Japonica Group]